MNEEFLVLGNSHQNIPSSYPDFSVHSYEDNYALTVYTVPNHSQCHMSIRAGLVRPVTPDSFINKYGPKQLMFCSLDTAQVL